MTLRLNKNRKGNPARFALTEEMNALARLHNRLRAVDPDAMVFWTALIIGVIVLIGDRW